MADRISVMDGGRLVQSGAPDTLYSAPNSASSPVFRRGQHHPGDCPDRAVATAIGDFPAGDLADGSAAVVVVPGRFAAGKRRGASRRGLHRRHHPGPHARPDSLVHLAVHDLHLHARAAGVFLPAAGERVRLTVDPAQAFVFPAS